METPSFAAPEARDRVFSSWRLAEQLGAEVAKTKGDDVAEALLSLPQCLQNCRRQAAGFRGSVLGKLIEASGGIGIYAISGEPGPLQRPSPLQQTSGRNGFREYGFIAAVVAACTLAAILLRPVLSPVSLAMFYLLGTIAVAMRSSRRVALVTSLVSVAAFDFFCVPPYLTFALSDYEYLVTFAVMLITAVTISSLTTRIRAQAAYAVNRAARTQALYRLTKELTGELRDFDAARGQTNGRTSGVVGAVPAFARSTRRDRSDGRSA